MRELVEKKTGMRATEVWRLKSHYSQIACFSLSNGERIVAKDIMPWYLEALEPRERKGVVAHINAITLHFRERLKELEVSVTDEYECVAINDGRERAVHLFPDAGVNADTLLRELDNAPEREEVLVAVIEAAGGVLAQGNAPRVGIDLQLSNFCLHLGKRMVYVDLFPALCVYEGTPLVHFPNPADPVVVKNELGRKFHPLGILRRLRFSALSVDIGFEEIFMRALEHALPEDHARAAQDFFESLPDIQMTRTNRNGIHALIDEITPLTTDAAREMALRLIPQSGERSQILARVFDLSSAFSAHGVPASARLKELKALLHAYVPA